MKIRKATRADASAWSVLRTELWPNTYDSHRAEINEYFNGQAIDIACVYLLDIDGQVAGFIELNIRNFAEGSRRARVPYVEAWVVASAYRGKGYGKALMQFAQNWAQDQGYSELASDTELGNESSIAIHKHLGFNQTEQLVCFIKQLACNTAKRHRVAKAVVFGTVFYSVTTFGLAYFWHLALFNETYQALGYFEGSPNVGLGFISIVIQGGVLSYLYTRVNFLGRGMVRGLKFSSLVGVFFWTCHVLAFVAKQEVSRPFLFAGLETLFLMLQFCCFGVLIGLLDRK